MPKLKHKLDLYHSWGLPSYLARTYCGRTIRFGMQPNVGLHDERNCKKCQDVEAKLMVDDLHRLARTGRMLG
jgi:hypothetical protein